MVPPAQVRVRFADTDAMGVAHHGAYLAFFEIARVEAMRQVGYAYSGLVDQGLHSPVLEAFVRYRSPARFDDLLLVEAHVSDVRRARFRFEYAIRREDEPSPLATGHTVHACVSAETLRPVRLPPVLLTALARLRQ